MTRLRSFLANRPSVVAKASLFLGLAVFAAGCMLPSPVAVPATHDAPAVEAGAGVALATAMPAATAGWRTYTEPALGYSLSLPETVHFTSGTSKAGVYTARLQFDIPGVEGYQGLLLRVEPNPERHGIEQIVQDLYKHHLMGDPPPDLISQLPKVNVGGLSGVQLGANGDFSLVVPYEDHVYIIAPVHSGAASGIDLHALALFYKVLATLRIAQ